MNLNTLSAEALVATGLGVGFVVKSLAHSDRKYKVEALLSNGKFAITRIDTGVSYFVAGTEDRYEFVVNMSRIVEVKSEIAELTEQFETITYRLTELKEELNDYGVSVAV